MKMLKLELREDAGRRGPPEAVYVAAGAIISVMDEFRGEGSVVTTMDDGEFHVAEPAATVVARMEGERRGGSDGRRPAMQEVADRALDKPGYYYFDGGWFQRLDPQPAEGALEGSADRRVRVSAIDYQGREVVLPEGSRAHEFHEAEERRLRTELAQLMESRKALYAQVDGLKAEVATQLDRTHAVRDRLTRVEAERDAAVEELGSRDEAVRYWRSKAQGSHSIISQLKADQAEAGEH